MKTAADKTATNFARQNPGLALGRSKIRDLPRQVHLWCTNATVFKASAHLLPRVLRELTKPEYPEFPTSSGPINQFKKFLTDYHPFPQVTSAAPGTSDHGQDRAVDFIVTKNGRTLAGTSTAKDKDSKKTRIKLDWEETGYDKALKKATIGTGLDGPLAEPHEPWHYWLSAEALAEAKKKPRR
jgi:hypothetical protein